MVYVGYTPGYTSSYYSHGCVVWSTGWGYRPWYGHYYYPRPATWGFRVSYHPYYGWGFGITWSNGPFSISIGGRGSGYRYGGAWFGAGGYRPYARPYVGVGFHKTTININNPTIGRGGNRPGGVGGTRPGTRPSAGTKDRPRGNNIYDRPQNRDRNVARPATSDRQRPNVARRR